MESTLTNILLITLGNSPMIIPEAFLGYGVRFDEVHVFSTDNPRLNENIDTLKQEFLSHFPEIIFTLTCTREIPLPNDTESQKLFDEALFQWYILNAKNHHPYVCISGGTKTIPASMQQAGRYFGATDVFHVIADVPASANPKNMDEVRDVIKNEKVKIIHLGEEPGWQHFRELTPRTNFCKISVDNTIPFLYWINKPKDVPVRRNIDHIIRSIQRHSSNSSVTDFPFGMLRLMPPEIMEWLQKPVSEKEDYKWVKSLPKVELHCHLGGFATHGELLEKVRTAVERKTFSETGTPKLPDGWPLPPKPIDLSTYMALGNANGSALLKDRQCLEKQIELLYSHLLDQNIRYAEIRCSPDNYATKDRPAWTVLQDIISFFQKNMNQALKKDRGTACHVNLLIIATRKREGDLSSISRHLALAITAAQFRENKTENICRVVGVDLAGYENKETRPAYFANDFIGIHRSGIAVTAHAGENDDAESIWQAVYQLQARRIGHGLELLQAEDLMRTMAERQIGIEMCPYANYQIKGFKPMDGQDRSYPLLKYMEAGIPVTVNTDNIGISSANLTDNFILLAHLTPGITRLQILHIIRNSISVAFIHPEFRQNLLSQMETQVFHACLNSKN